MSLQFNVFSWKFILSQVKQGLIFGIVNSVYELAQKSQNDLKLAILGN